MSGSLLDQIGGLLGMPQQRSLLDGGQVFYPQNLTAPSPYVRELTTDPRVAAAQARREFTDPAARGVGMNTVMGFAEGPAAIRAFHGSPHRFDRFDMSRIGTGEGAQAYGHGLYFAGSEDVARSYRDALANNPGQTPESIAQYWVAHSQGDRTAARAALQDSLRSWESNPMVASDRSLAAMVQRMRDATPLIDTVTPTTGHMYEVRLNTDPSRLLDWDRPLSQQPQAVQDRIASLANRSIGPRDPYPDMTGGQWYADATAGGMRNRQVAGVLSEPLPGTATRAVDGIQYLDQGSRAAGEGTRNYVMFDDKLIDIMRRYGLLPLATGAATGGLLSQENVQ